MSKLFTAALVATTVFLGKDRESTPTLTVEEQRVSNSVGNVVPMKTALDKIDAYHQEVGDMQSRSVAFGRATVEKILAQKGCVGIRSYFVKAKNGQKTLVMVGFDKDMKDIATNTSTNLEKEGVAGEGGPVCPPECAYP